MDLGLELVAVFAAVTLAFWAENLREARADRLLGRSYLEGILEDLRRDAAGLETVIANQRRILEAASGTLDYFDGKTIEVDPFLEGFYAVLNWDDFKPNRTAFQEVVSTGGLRLIRSSPLRQNLLDLSTRYDALRVLEQHVFKDYNSYIVDPMIRKLRLRLPGPWSDDPRYEGQIRDLTSDFLLENGIRGLAIQVELWLLPELESVQGEVTALVAEVDAELANRRLRAGGA
jgi:hypothetical protein